MSGRACHRVIAAGAELAGDVSIGAYSIIGSARAPRRRHDRQPARRHRGHARRSVRAISIFQFASIGAEPQDLKYHGEDERADHRRRQSHPRVLHRCSPAPTGGGMLTSIGSGNLLMNYSHIAHDCILGDRNVVANGVQLGGHVTIEDGVVARRAGRHPPVRARRRVGASSAPGRWCRRMCRRSATPPATAPRCTVSTAVGLKRARLLRTRPSRCSSAPTASCSSQACAPASVAACPRRSATVCRRSSASSRSSRVPNAACAGRGEPAEGRGSEARASLDTCSSNPRDP